MNKNYRTYEVKAVNLNGVEVIQKIQAASPDQAKIAVTRKNKYLEIKSVVACERTDETVAADQDCKCRLGGRTQ